MLKTLRERSAKRKKLLAQTVSERFMLVKSCFGFVIDFVFFFNSRNSWV